jgi:hypothetical protein
MLIRPVVTALQSPVGLLKSATPWRCSCPLQEVPAKSGGIAEGHRPQETSRDAVLRQPRIRLVEWQIGPAQLHQARVIILLQISSARSGTITYRLVRGGVVSNRLLLIDLCLQPAQHGIRFQEPL